MLAFHWNICSRDHTYKSIKYKVWIPCGSNYKVKLKYRYSIWYWNRWYAMMYVDMHKHIYIYMDGYLGTLMHNYYKLNTFLITSSIVLYNCIRYICNFYYYQELYNTEYELYITTLTLPWDKVDSTYNKIVIPVKYISQHIS